jgi:hypothetical protein
LVLHLFGSLQNIEKEEECSDIEKREGSGSSKSQTPIEKEAVAIERTADDLRRAQEKGQNWISMDK